MNKKHILAVVLFSLGINFYSFCQNESIIYKQVDTTKLKMKVFRPLKMDTTKKYPAIVFFFGGGWTDRYFDQFDAQAKYFSKRGVVCFIPDYRVKSIQQTSPFESLKDAKSAIRYIREHANEFHIDAQKIVASGGSAGGQLAAATALINGFNEDSDDLSLSCKPNALILFNPVIDNGPGGFGYPKINMAYKEFSPLHNIKKGAPPTVIFQGTADEYIAVETIKYYQMVMEKVGSRCDVHFYEGMKHGFFNYSEFENYKQTVSESDMFLQSLEYLKKEPVIEIK